MSVATAYYIDFIYRINGFNESKSSVDAYLSIFTHIFETILQQIKADNLYLTILPSFLNYFVTFSVYKNVINENTAIATELTP